VTATVLENLMLKSNPKRLLVEMLVNREAKRAAGAGAAPEQAAAAAAGPGPTALGAPAAPAAAAADPAALRLELQASGLPALEARARGLGVTATVLEKLMLKSNPKRLLVEMLVNREAKRAAEAG
jgi:hypothetical protein